METSVGDALVCPKCAAALEQDDSFCAACGARRVPIEPVAPAPAAGPTPVAYEVIEARSRASKLATARKLLLAMAGLTLISGVVMYFLQRNNVEKQIRDAEAQMGEMSPEERDAAMKSKIGMTWEDAKAHDRGEVTLRLVVNIGLAVFYLGMWLWARKNVLAAAITALLLYVTVLAVNGVLEPKTLVAGYQLKVGFIAILVIAIDAGYKARRAEAT